MPVNLVFWLQVSGYLVTDVWFHLADIYAGSVLKHTRLEHMRQLAN